MLECRPSSTESSSAETSHLVGAELPIDLQRLLQFIFEDSIPFALIDSASNAFFAPSKTDARVELRRGEAGCWDLLPEEWRLYFESVEDAGQRDGVVRDLAQGALRSEWPASLKRYLETCASLSLDRACSPIPVLAWPPRASTSQSPGSPPLAGSAPSNNPSKAASNAARAGQSPKKSHEVERSVALVGSLLDSEPEAERSTHAIDVGSGRAHLSRALAQPPLDLNVLAVDYSASQTSGADSLSAIKARQEDRLQSKSDVEATSAQRSTKRRGSLTTRTTDRLDAEGVGALLKLWPPPSPPPSSSVDPASSNSPPAMMIALHACGDLTVACVEAHIASELRARQTAGSRPHVRPAVLVGCCYNLLTLSTFPLSRLVSDTVAASLGSAPRQPLTRSHTRLTPHAPATWHLTPAHSKSWYSSVTKLALRARLEAELVASGFGETTRHGYDGMEAGDTKRRVGRVNLQEGEGWEAYRAKALVRFYSGGRGDGAGAESQNDDEVKGLDMDAADWQRSLWLMSVWWTLRCLIGPVVESVLVLDRWARLVEGLHDSSTDARVEVVNVFDQATGSLRNLALVVR